MTELIRPALYGASHPVVPVSAHYGPAPRSTDVEGPVCESADSFGQHLLPQLRRGDRVAIALAGAYGSSQGSRYNGRGRPAELLIEPDGTIITCQEAQPVGLPAAR
jgi:diaminopimelate decarboxylase